MRGRLDDFDFEIAAGDGRGRPGAREGRDVDDAVVQIPPADLIGAVRARPLDANLCARSNPIEMVFQGESTLQLMQLGQTRARELWHDLVI